MSTAHKGLWHTFRAPLLLALMSSVGLLAALIGDGVFDLLSWLALGCVPAVIAWYWAKANV